MSSHRVSAMDLLRARTTSEQENQRQIKLIYGGALAFVLAVDVACAAGLCVAHAGASPAALWRAVARLEWRFKTEVVDLALLALLRAALFPLLTALAIRLGKPRRAGPRRAPTDSRQSTDASYVPLADLGDTGDENVDGGAAAASAEASDADQQRAKRSAAVRKHAVMTSIFLASTACQVYVGVKINVFSWGADVTHPAAWLKPVQVVLMCVSVLLINVAAFLARELTTELTRHAGLFLPHVHAHPLVFDGAICRHWCDLCSTPIRHGGAWRCKLCDFDMCMPCASRKDAATVGENVLRSDRGARVEQSVSSAAYLRRAILLAANSRGLLWLAMALLAANSGIALLMPKYQGKIIDRVVRHERGAFTTAVSTYLALMVLQGLCRAGYSAAFSVVSRTILYEVRTELFKAVVRQDVAFFDGTTSGHLTSRLTNDAQTMMAPIDSSLSSLLYNVIMLFGGVVMCFTTSYTLSMLAFVVVGPIMYCWDLYGNWSKNLSRKVLSAWAEANSVATECLAHVRTVKSFVTEGAETAKYDDACGEALRLGIKDSLGFGLTSALTGYLDLGTGVLILWYGGLIVLGGEEGLTIGELVTFQLYWNMMNSSYQNLQGLITSFTRSAAAAEKVFSLIDSLPDISADSGAHVDAEAVKGALELREVDFYYVMRPDALVLRKLSLAIAPRTTCALVGRSGGGKSTIISLLMRFYDPRSGAVLLDGVDVRSLRVKDYRGLFGVVAQDTPLFARSVAENIAYGSEGATAAEIEAAANAACAHDFIADMKDGYATRVGERGGRLSGGQRQRVAIARVFLRRPKLVLLDEATSALDEDSQAAVQKSLDALIARGDSTVVLVAHRLSTVMGADQSADQIAVIDAGAVVERGDHDALLAQGGVYASLVKRQLSKAASTLDQTKEADGAERRAQADTIDKLLDDISKAKK